MSIRKRTWRTRAGERTAWVVDYTDQQGKRRLKTFERKSDAVQYRDNTGVQIAEGTHVADRASVTVKEAGELWLKTSEASGLERSTIEEYGRLLRLHIVPFLRREKLAGFTAPKARAFRDRLHQDGDEPHEKARSPAMVRAIMSALSSILADAQERGLTRHNVVRELRGRRRRGHHKQQRRKRKLQVGVDIPTPHEVRALLSTVRGRWRPLLFMAVFSGLRSSELRGLRWTDLDLHKGEVHVRQRADRYNIIGSPKSSAGTRTVPLPPTVVQELRQWKLVCPKRKERGDKIGQLVLVFPNGKGHVENGGNILHRGLKPILIKAGITRPVLDKKTGHPKRDDEGKPIVQAKYPGLHCLRHFFASWSINRKVDGGLELPAKVVQERLGHASIMMTLDTYGHLFPRGDDAAELATAEQRLLG